MKLPRKFSLDVCAHIVQDFLSSLGLASNGRLAAQPGLADDCFARPRRRSSPRKRPRTTRAGRPLFQLGRVEVLEPRLDVCTLIFNPLTSTLFITGGSEATISVDYDSAGYVRLNGVSTTYAAEAIGTLSIQGINDANAIYLYGNAYNGSNTIHNVRVYGHGSSTQVYDLNDYTGYGGGYFISDYGGSDYNELDGGSGTDVLNAGYGGAYNALYGGSGNETLNGAGSSGTNVLFDGGGTNTLHGGSGENDLLTSGGTNTLYGGSGTNFLAGNGGVNTLYGSSGANYLGSMGGINTLNGGAGDNTLNGYGGGYNVLNAGPGNNELDGDSSNNSGIDILNGAGGAHNLLNGGAGHETLYGGNGTNILNDGGGSNTLDATHYGKGTLHGASGLTITGTGSAYTLMNNATGPVMLTVNASASGTVALTSANNTFIGPTGPLTAGNANHLSLVKSGTGSQTLSGPNTYDGATTINAGTLALANDAGLGNTAIAVNASGTLAGHPSAAGVVTAGLTGTGSAGASLALNGGSAFSMVDGSLGTFQLNHQTGFSGTSLAINDARLSFDLSSSGADALIAGGSATVAGINTIDINVVGTSLSPDQTYNLVTATGGLSGFFIFADGSNAEAVTVGGQSYTLTLRNSGIGETLSVATTDPTAGATIAPLDFVWPAAPDDNALVIPADSDQSQPPAAPTYDGVAFDYTQDAAYLAAVALAEQHLTSDTQSAQSLLQAALPLTPRHLPVIVTVSNSEILAVTRKMPENEFEVYRHVAAMEIWNDYQRTLLGLRSRGLAAVSVPAQELSTATIDEYLRIKESARL